MFKCLFGRNLLSEEISFHNKDLKYRKSENDFLYNSRNYDQIKSNFLGKTRQFYQHFSNILTERKKKQFFQALKSVFRIWRQVKILPNIPGENTLSITAYICNKRNEFERFTWKAKKKIQVEL